MSLAQEVVESTTSSVRLWQVPAIAGLLLFALPTVVHAGRALAVRARSVDRWLAARGFEPSETNRAEVQRFLRRFRWTRAGASAVFFCIAAVLMTQLGVGIGLLTGPYLLALLVAEATAPAPPRGRTRSAALVARGRDYFAPYRSLWLARLLVAAAAVVAVAAAPGAAARFALAHAAVMAAGLLTLEVALAVGARRALPEAGEALALETAMRVQAARTTIAAAAVFGAVGFWYSTLLLAVDDPLGGSRTVLSLLGPVLLHVGLGVAISLAVPLRSWQPRHAT
jgi:hypothetical protein